MPLPQRKLMEVSVAERENLSRRPIKPAAVKKPVLVTQRPVLGELGNKIHSQQQNQSKVTAKKVGAAASTTVGLPIAKKTTVKVQKQTTSINSVVTKTESIVKESESVVVSQSDVALKHIVRIANNYKVGEVSYSTKQLIGVIDADANDKDDPFLVTEYIQDIFSYLRSLETRYNINQHYMTAHRSSPRMRSVLVNWMVEVQINFKFLLETLHLSVAILDRYLQVNPSIARETLQLVGTTAMIIAGKYEEMYMPEISDFVYICDNTFSRREFLKMEQDMLCKLEFNIGRPLSLHFLRRYNKVAHIQAEHHNLAKYLLEIFLLEYELCHIDPSLQAAAACCLSISILNDVRDPAKVWTKTLAYYSNYKYSDMKPTILKLAYFLGKMEKSKYQAVRKKYSGSNFGKISLHPKLQSPLVKRLMEEAQALKKS